MYSRYAHQFSEIPATLAEVPELREEILRLIDAEPMAGKVTEGGDRLDNFRLILRQLVTGEIDLSAAYYLTERELPRSQSIHAADNRVFPSGWAERLVRTQFSRFYNQAIMEDSMNDGETECYVPHSSEEDGNSECSLTLAGRTHDLKLLHDRLIASYRNGNWSREPKIPGHPHCTHVITPTREIR